MTIEQKTWTKWHGGECPLASDVEIEAELRNGARYEGQAGQFMRGRWEHSNHLEVSDHIIAYRVVQS